MQSEPLNPLYYKESGSKGNIPWHDTKLLQANRKVLNQMINHYPADHFVTQFLTEYAGHCLVPPKGDTGITYSFFDGNSLSDSKNAVRLTEEFTASQFPSQSGVYHAWKLGDEKDLSKCHYSGSSIDHVTRWRNHYSSVRGDSTSPLHKAMRTFGPSQFKWTEVGRTFDYLGEFIKLNPGVSRDGVMTDILRTFTQYEARLLEQSIISAIEPGLNSKTVLLTTEWYPDTITERAERPIEVTTKSSNTVHHYSSLREAARLTDVHFWSASNILNYPGYWRYSSKLEDLVSFIDHSRPLNTGSPHSLEHRDVIKGIDYASIPANTIHAFTEDLTFFDEYSGGQVAGKACGVSKKTVLTNMNKVFCSCVVGGVSIRLLFARNPELKALATAPTSVVLTDIINNQSYYYSSIATAMTALSISEHTRTSAIRTNYIKGNRIYHKRWAWSLATDWEGQLPMEGPAKLL